MGCEGEPWATNASKGDVSSWLSNQATGAWKSLGLARPLAPADERGGEGKRATEKGEEDLANAEWPCEGA